MVINADYLPKNFVVNKAKMKILIQRSTRENFVVFIKLLKIEDWIFSKPS